MVVEGGFLWLDRCDLDLHGHISCKTVDSFNLSKVRRKKINGLYHYRYDSLSPKTIKKLPSEDHLKAIQGEYKQGTNLDRILQSLHRAESHHSHKHLKLYRQYTSQEKAFQYAKSHTWHEQIIRLSKQHSLKALFEAVSSTDAPFKCTNYTKFTIRIKEAKKAITSQNLHGYIMHGNIENDYRKLIKDSTNGKAIIQWYSKLPGTNFDDVWHFYQREYQQHGWPKIKAVDTIANYLNDPKIETLWYDTKYGHVAAKRTIEPKLSRVKSTFPDALWGGDGTRIDIELQDGSGNWIPSLDIYWFFDSNTGKVTGHAIGKGEKSTLVQTAYKNAIRGTGYLPYQVYYDPGKANISKEVEDLFSKTAKVHFPHEAKRPEPLRTESLTKQIQNQVMKFMESWTGGNITSGNKANPDLLEKLRKENSLPTIEQLEKEVGLIIKAWNQSTWKRDQSRDDLYYSTSHEKRRKIDQADIIELFMVKRRQTVKYTQHGLKIQVDGKEIIYTVQDDNGNLDYAFYSKYLHRPLDIYYDNDNLEWIALGYKGKRLPQIASLKPRHKEAIADYEPGDKEKLDKERELRNNFMNENKERYNKLMEECESEGIAKMDFQTVFKDVLNDAHDIIKARSNGAITKPEGKRQKAGFSIENSFNDKL